MNNPMRVHIARTIPAPREAVFEAWLDPQRLARFLKPAPGVVVSEQKVDARVGGGFSLVFLAGERRIPVHGDYTAIDRYDRIAFTWHDTHTLPENLVTLTFASAGPRSTRITLEHTGFPDQQERDNHNDGWGEILACLERELAA